MCMVQIMKERGDGGVVCLLQVLYINGCSIKEKMKDRILIQIRACHYKVSSYLFLYFQEKMKTLLFLRFS